MVPYGNPGSTASLAMVGKMKTPPSLAELMPSTEIAAKVGVATGVGQDDRVVRRRAGEG